MIAENNKFTLSAEKREITGKKVKVLREKGLIPAVVYGHGTNPQTISVNRIKFDKVFAETGTSTLVDLEIGEEKPVKVLTHEPQYDPVRGNPIHIDFYKVKMDEKIKTEIPLEFTGESEAVTQLDGNLVTNRDNVEVECLPNDLASHIEVDISPLKTFEDTIAIKDLQVPPGIEILDDPEEVIALVEPPRSEEELAELEESAAEEEKEAIEQMGAEAEVKKTEGEEESEKSEPESKPEEQKEN